MEEKRTRLRRVAPLLLPLLAASCATIAADGHGDLNLPDAHDGPFRPLKRGQVCTHDGCTGVDELPENTATGVVHYPNAPPARSPSVLVRGSGGSDLHVVIYAARGLGRFPDHIMRMESPDARSFSDVQDVLAADASDGVGVDEPFAMDVDGSIWLYYSIDTELPVGVGAFEGGIVRAVSTDGLEGRAFVKDAAHIEISGEKGAWETATPRAPSVLRAPDGTFHLFYAAAGSIGEATGNDGVHFTRVDADPSTPDIDPVLGPTAPVDPDSLPVGVRPPFDDLAVDDPSVARAVTVAGRVTYRMHYTGRDRRGGSWIGLAGRFGESGSFEKDPAAVYGNVRTNPHVNAPTIAHFPDFSLVYCNVDTDTVQAIGVGVAPAAIKLPID